MKATILLLFLFLSLNASAYVKDTTFVVNTAENTYEISFFSQHVRIDNVKIRNYPSNDADEREYTTRKISIGNESIGACIRKYCKIPLMNVSFEKYDSMRIGIKYDLQGKPFCTCFSYPAKLMIPIETIEQLEKVLMEKVKIAVKLTRPSSCKKIYGVEVGIDLNLRELQQGIDTGERIW
ncbi:hypothetical protein [Bacteroides caecimuris]|uniref:Uncharacterized protein n=1 Tax=Bacteroides caecimuris TaxID=1796613 RepID=A0A4S2DFZ7_9BACE|nr:hypothetical protein [Bacteroides caecimuris]TGY40645.1 hypothetical protein E5353_01670 [Bacteroides caecimuris]